MLVQLADETVIFKVFLFFICLVVQVGGLLTHVQNGLGDESNNQSWRETAAQPIIICCIFCNRRTPSRSGWWSTSGIYTHKWSRRVSCPLMGVIDQMASIPAMYRARPLGHGFGARAQILQHVCCFHGMAHWGFFTLNSSLCSCF